MNKSSVLLLFLPVLASCGGGPSGDAVLTEMLMCRKTFDTSLATLADASKGLDAQRKLEVLLKAVTARSECEEKAIAPLRK